MWSLRTLNKLGLDDELLEVSLFPCSLSVSATVDNTYINLWCFHQWKQRKTSLFVKICFSFISGAHGKPLCVIKCAFSSSVEHTANHFVFYKYAFSSSVEQAGHSTLPFNDLQWNALFRIAGCANIFLISSFSIQSIC